jgi:cytoskeletal protein RodZ
VRTIAKNSNNHKGESVNQGTPKPTKTDQEILEELKQASSGERRRSAGLTAFVVLLIIVIAVFAMVNRRTKDEEANTSDTNVTENADTSENDQVEPDQDEDADDTADESTDDETDTTNSTEPTDASNDTTETTDTTEPTITGEAPGELPTVGSTHTDSEYTEVAQVGEGVTHLARRATHQFLADKSITDLSAEHKVFIEDYLAKHSNPVFLDLTEQRTFSAGLMDEAVSAARSLTAADLANLQQYSVLVPGL